MNLFAGLERFGVNAEKAKKAEQEMFSDTKIFEQEFLKVSQTPQSFEPITAKSEEAYLFSKKVQCTVCQKEFETKGIRSSKLRRLQADFDLRPRYRDIDPLKYDVYCCPNCGYTAMSKFFGHLTRGQIALVKENVCANYQPTLDLEPPFIDYEMAITRYKLSLYSSIIKLAKNSERAYTCLKIAWLYRDLLKELPEGTGEEKARKAEAQESYNEFYEAAFEGFQKAIASEDYPICGMDIHTMDYLMACLALNFRQFSYASKSVGSILASKTADRRIKDKALDLKTYILEQIKKESNKQ